MGGEVRGNRQRLVRFTRDETASYVLTNIGFCRERRAKGQYITAHPIQTTFALRQHRMGARKIKRYFSLVLSTNRQYLPVQHCSYCCELKRSEDDLGYCMCSLRCCTSMDLCELRAVHEYERQPVAHITTCGLSSARVSNAETPGLMCSRIMETWENNVNKAEVPGDQFSSSCFLS